MSSEGHSIALENAMKAFNGLIITAAGNSGIDTDIDHFGQDPLIFIITLP